MQKREYANLFSVAANPTTMEISLSFRQEGVELDFDPRAEKRIYSLSKEIFDVGAVVLTVENARQLVEQLINTLNSVTEQNQEQELGQESEHEKHLSNN